MAIAIGLIIGFLLVVTYTPNDVAPIVSEERGSGR